MHMDALRLARRVAALIAPWDRADTPGVTVGVLRGDALVLQQSAGQASLELGVPIGAETCFRIASVTKQFTCAAILLLAQEGRLRVTDAVQQHLPELPDFGAPVTLDHLMRNSSGLRDMLELLRIGGAGLAQPCTQQDLLDAICRQRSLNFPPGSGFRYSNSGFVLLGLVVERITGEPLGDFLQRRFFAPLGMTRTRMVATTTEVVPGLCTGYLPRDGGFIRAPHAFPVGGEGGLVSCVQDLALWARNYTTAEVGGAALKAALQQQVAFTNGAMNRYARGLEHGRHRGLATIDHGGLWPGYKTCFLRVPERDLAIIAIANHGGIDVHHLAHQVLDAAEEPELSPAPPMPRGMDALYGRWVDIAGGATAEFHLGADGTPMATTHGVSYALAPTEDGKLAARRGVFPFTVSLPQGDVLRIEADAGGVAEYRPAPFKPALPEGLAGRYHCAELATDWTLQEDGNALLLQIAGPLRRAGPWPVEPIAGDLLRAPAPDPLFPAWLDVQVQRDKTGAITALVVNGARASGLVFTRL